MTNKHKRVCQKTTQRKHPRRGATETQTCTQAQVVQPKNNGIDLSTLLSSQTSEAHLASTEISAWGNSTHFTRDLRECQLRLVGRRGLSWSGGAMRVDRLPAGPPCASENITRTRARHQIVDPRAAGDAPGPRAGRSTRRDDAVRNAREPRRSAGLPCAGETQASSLAGLTRLESTATPGLMVEATVIFLM